MAITRKALLCGFVWVGLAGCDPRSKGIDTVQGIDGKDGGSSEMDGGVEGDVIRAFGVVSNNFTVTSVSLLGGDGKILGKDFVNSGSAPAGLVTALSGDLVLPTRSGDPGTVTLIDRLRTDVITRIDPTNGAVLGQVKTHKPNNNDDDASYSSNPHDYVYFDRSNAWVTRFGANANAPEGDPDRGVDLLQINPTTFERGGRISFWSFNGTAERQNEDTMATETVTTYARPARMVRLKDHLVVGIASLSLGFDAAGEGMVALVDVEARTAVPLRLPGLKNCGDVAPVADDSDRVVVACIGFFRGVPRDSAGLAVLKLEGDVLKIEHIWRGVSNENAPLSVAEMISLGGNEVAAVANGNRAVVDDAGNETTPATNDTMYVIDIETGSQTKLFEATGRYKIGSGAFNPANGLLLVPDASSDGDGKPIAGVRSFRREEKGSFTPAAVIRVHDILPPRQVRAL